MRHARLIHLSIVLDNWLREEATRNGISVSELVRRLLDKERVKQERQERKP